MDKHDDQPSSAQLSDQRRAGFGVSSDRKLVNYGRYFPHSGGGQSSAVTTASAVHLREDGLWYRVPAVYRVSYARYSVLLPVWYGRSGCTRQRSVRLCVPTYVLYHTQLGWPYCHVGLSRLSNDTNTPPIRSIHGAVRSHTAAPTGQEHPRIRPMDLLIFASRLRCR